MAASSVPCLNIAIAPLKASKPNHWAIWVLQAPYPGGYVHHDCIWSDELTQLWQAWQALFSLQANPNVTSATIPLPSYFPGEDAGSYSRRLMQHFGINLWQWLFQGSIYPCFSQSQGIAIGQAQPLRIRLELRHPSLVPIPWEILQPQNGKQAISLNKQLLFSRTTSDVDPLSPPRLSQSLNVLLVLGQVDKEGTSPLQLHEEAEILKTYLTSAPQDPGQPEIPCSVPRRVDVLVQPTRADLVKHLEVGNCNLFFYAGHGLTAPDGGRLLLSSAEFLSGTELAQVLVRCRVTLAVFNACWGAQLDYVQNSETSQLEAVPRSSLAETLIHHGVPSVLAMRDVIADEEALSFIQSFTQALSDRSPIDEAVAIARQRLLTLYRFNQPAWTLPVLYMHPEFDGQLIQPFQEQTELPTNIPALRSDAFPSAEVRSLADPPQVWPIRGGLMRVGRRTENDLVLQEQWVSQQHAEIIYRSDGENYPQAYFLRDFSRFGTMIMRQGNWLRVHHQEIPLNSGTQMRFGSPQGQILEFVILSSE